MASPSPSALRTTTAVLGITSTLVLSGINIGTSLLFVPHLYAITTTTANNPDEPLPSARIFDGLYHTGAKAVVPLAAAGILSLGGLAASSYYQYYYYYSPASSASSPFSSSHLSRGAGHLAATTTATAAPALQLALAAGLVASTLVWTRVVVMPVNNRLVGLARGRAKGSDERGEVAALLRRWERMNYVRGFVALAAGVLALSAVVVV